MMRLLVLIPIIMCAIWCWYLHTNNYTLKQGLKGFGYIFAFNGIIIGFLVVMIYVTH